MVEKAKCETSDYMKYQYLTSAASSVPCSDYSMKDDKSRNAIFACISSVLLFIIFFRHYTIHFM